jgi:glycerophosphoryl diester phosphodiesterase
MKTRFCLLFAGVLMTGVATGQYLPKFDIQGHRGARGLKPENTVPAFIAALELGVTTVELDVVITKDRQVVVSHEPWMSADICSDPSGNPISERDQKKYNIYELTYDEVRSFDCGGRGNATFPEQEKLEGAKPLLSDVIVAVERYIKSYASYEVDYNIEIKSIPEGDGKFHPSVAEYSDLVYALVDEYIPMDRLVIQSFDFRVLQYWHEKYPQIRLSALVGKSKSVEDDLNRLGFKPTVYSPHFESLTREKVAYAHQQKIRVIPWTVNEVSSMLSLKGMGVDGFITDYPDRASKYKMTLNIQPRAAGKR